MFNCFPDADARAQARVGLGLATPLDDTRQPTCWVKDGHAMYLSCARSKNTKQSL